MICMQRRKEFSVGPAAAAQRVSVFSRVISLKLVHSPEGYLGVWVWVGLGYEEERNHTQHLLFHAL